MDLTKVGSILTVAVGLVSRPSPFSISLRKRAMMSRSVSSENRMAYKYLSIYTNEHTIKKIALNWYICLYFRSNKYSISEHERLLKTLKILLTLNFLMVIIQKTLNNDLCPHFSKAHPGHTQGVC